MFFLLWAVLPAFVCKFRTELTKTDISPMSALQIPWLNISFHVYGLFHALALSLMLKLATARYTQSQEDRTTFALSLWRRESSVCAETATTSNATLGAPSV